MNEQPFIPAKIQYSFAVKIDPYVIQENVHHSWEDEHFILNLQ